MRSVQGLDPGQGNYKTPRKRAKWIVIFLVAVLLLSVLATFLINHYLSIPFLYSFVLGLVSLGMLALLLMIIMDLIYAFTGLPRGWL